MEQVLALTLRKQILQSIKVALQFSFQLPSRPQDDANNLPNPYSTFLSLILASRCNLYLHLHPSFLPLILPNLISSSFRTFLLLSLLNLLPPLFGLSRCFLGQSPSIAISAFSKIFVSLPLLF